jgi:peptidoglycan/LPS O-acetylase OafA/YrhL
LALIFQLEAIKRRTIIILAILAFLSLNQCIHWQIRNIFGYIHYFLLGFLLVDFKINSLKFNLNKTISIVVGTTAFCCVWYFGQKNIPNAIFENIVYGVMFLCSIFIFYCFALFDDMWKRILSTPIITTIGGMCYTIYLIHFSIISLVGNYLVEIKILDYYFIDYIAYYTIILLVILIISGVFFKCIEQPCMEKKWYRKLMKNKYSLNNITN